MSFVLATFVLFVAVQIHFGGASTFSSNRLEGEH